MSVKHFKGEYRFLSNFGPVTVKLDGDVYPSVEHAYQAAKTLDLDQRKQFQANPKITDLPASTAKTLGTHLPLRADWESVKLAVMEDLLRQKFAPGTALRERLDATSGQHLEEGNWWHDTFWGKCECKEHKGRGENNLGRLLMKIRDDK